MTKDDCGPGSLSLKPDTGWHTFSFSSSFLSLTLKFYVAMSPKIFAEKGPPPSAFSQNYNVIRSNSHSHAPPLLNGTYIFSIKLGGFPCSETVFPDFFKISYHHVEGKGLKEEEDKCFFCWKHWHIHPC